MFRLGGYFLEDRSCGNCKHWEELDSQAKFLKTVFMGRCGLEKHKVYTVKTSFCDCWACRDREVSWYY